MQINIDTMIEDCDDGVTRCTSANQAERGGAIPASSLTWGNDSKSAIELVSKFHYSHRPPGLIQHVTTAHLSTGLCVGACFFSRSMGKWKVPLWELSRLVRHDDYKIPLTAMIAWSVRQIKKECKIDLLISYADRDQGHDGIVYRAAGWRLHGTRRPTIDGYFVDGVFVPKRTMSYRYGSVRPSHLHSLGVNVIPHKDSGRHMYWKSLSKRGDNLAAIAKLRDTPW